MKHLFFLASYLPNPTELAQWEKLGIVAFLFAVLVALSIAVTSAAVWLGLNVKQGLLAFAERHLDQMEQQTLSMLRIETKQDHMIKGQSVLLNYFICWLPNCPIKKIKQEQYEADSSISNNVVQSGGGSGSDVGAGPTVGGSPPR